MKSLKTLHTWGEIKGETIDDTTQRITPALTTIKASDYKDQ